MNPLAPTRNKPYSIGSSYSYTNRLSANSARIQEKAPVGLYLSVDRI